MNASLYQTSANILKYFGGYGYNSRLTDIYPDLLQLYQMTAKKLMLRVHVSDNKLSSLDHNLDHCIYSKNYSRIQCSRQHQHQHIMIWFYAVIGGYWFKVKHKTNQIDHQTRIKNICNHEHFTTNFVNGQDLS